MQLTVCLQPLKQKFRFFLLYLAIGNHSFGKPCKHINIGFFYFQRSDGGGVPFGIEAKNFVNKMFFGHNLNGAAFVPVSHRGFNFSSIVATCPFIAGNTANNHNASALNGATRKGAAPFQSFFNNRFPAAKGKFASKAKGLTSKIDWRKFFVVALEWFFDERLHANTSQNAAFWN